ncbi:MAG: hypothetical protein RLY20_3406 [Verrucomicrobiota bacterium]|jgi:uncharacterized protein (DUF58 family)
MIVPRNRLLLWTALIVLPFALLAAIEPATTVVVAALVGGFAVVAAVDAFGARRGLRGISAELPAIARMSKDRAAKLDLRLRNAPQSPRQLRVGLALPEEIVSEEEALTVALPAGSEWSHLSWPCTPRKRGNFKLDAVYLETNSPLGFWAGRKQVAAKSEIRVYPNLMTERKNLAALFMNRGSFGVHALRQVGKGRDFEKLREYVPGDSFDEVHWKATARRGKPITKVFQVERTQEVYVVIDASRLTARAPGKEITGDTTTTLERFITAALVLGLAAEKQGDHFGLITFSDTVGKFVRAKNGKAHYSACRDALYTLEPRTVSPDFEELCTFIRLRLRRRALLVFLTALDDTLLAESFVHNLDLIRSQHLVLVNMLQPPGAVPVFTNPNLTTVDELYQHLGGHLQWQKLRALEKVLQRRGARFATLENELLCADVVTQYLGVKQRQLL